MCYAFAYSCNKQLLAEIDSTLGAHNYRLFELGGMAYFYSAGDEFVKAFLELLNKYFIFYKKVPDEEMLRIVQTLTNAAGGLGIESLGQYRQQYLFFSGLVARLSAVIKTERNHKRKMALYREAIENIHRMTALNRQMTIQLNELRLSLPAA